MSRASGQAYARVASPFSSAPSVRSKQQHYPFFSMARKHVGPLPLSAYATPGMIGIGDDGMIKKGIGAGLQKVCSHAAPQGSPLRACGAIGSVSARARRAYRTRSTLPPHPLLVSSHDDCSFLTILVPLLV